MASHNTFHCSVVTPEKAVFDGDVRFVALPAHDGELGILPRRAPLLCRLGVGPLRIRFEDGEDTPRNEIYFVDSGFAQMVDNRLTILTEQAFLPNELDREDAENALAAAQAISGRAGVKAYRERQHALIRARAQIRMASKE